MTAGKSSRRAAAAAPRKRRTAPEIRRRLLDAARDEFAERGYAGATTSAISKRADVAEIQMFRYFPSKAELFQEAVFAPLTEHFRAFNQQHGAEAVDPATIADRARQYASELLAFLTANADALVSLYVAQTYGAPGSDPSAMARTDLKAFFDEAARTMAERTPGATDTDPGMVVRIAFGALLGCITYRDWLFPDAAAGDPATGRAITEFVLAGIAPHSDLQL